MGLFDNFPYTNFHELNLDWMLDELKKAIIKFGKQYEDVEAWRQQYAQDFQDLVDYVDNYFENLNVDEEVTAKVNETVAEMVADGSIEAIIAQHLAESQVMDLAPVLYTAETAGRQTVNDDPSLRTSFMQACASDGNNIYQILMRNDPEREGPGLIKVFNRASHQRVGDGWHSINYVGHGNGADWYEGKLYIATGGSTITIVDTATWEESSVDVVDRNSAPQSLGSISIDNDGTMYGRNSGQYFTIDYSADPYVATPVSSITSWWDNSAYQSGCVRDGYAYEAGINPSCVYKIHVATGQLIHIYPIDRYVDLYCVGEVETVCADRSGRFFVGSCAYIGYGNYNFAGVFEANFTHNVAPRRRYSGGSILNIGAMYTGGDVTEGLPDGSESKPWPVLSMAVAALYSPIAREFGTFTIQLGANAGESLYLRNTSVVINGNGYSVQCVYAQNCDIAISNMKIAHSHKSGQPTTRSAQFINCRVEIDDMDCSQSLAAADYTYQFNMCQANIYNINLTDALQSIGMYRTQHIEDNATAAYIAT